MIRVWFFEEVGLKQKVRPEAIEVALQGLCKVGHLRDKMRALWLGVLLMGMGIVGSCEEIGTGRRVGSEDEFNFFFIVF